ncbi:MAG: GAF domain-containing sensor histidine kinase [Anaerolineae bacterium]|nr:GAF domain-containing sensor histidine kinase [Anaerolineae bacterium]
MPDVSSDRSEDGQLLNEPADPMHLLDVRDDGIGVLGMALRDIAQALESYYHELQHLNRITSNINAGLLLDDIMSRFYDDFRAVIPYDRIGLSLIEDDGESVRARWANTDYPGVHLAVGYSSPLAGSSLQQIIETGKPRIINDLGAYLRSKPNSESSRLIFDEGVRSSLTCPLVVNGVPVGFLFFSSKQPHAYADAHVQTFMRVAEQISIIVEKGRLVSDLAQQKAAIEAQNEELRRLNDLKNAFIGVAAHDLRSPLAYIQMASDFLCTSGHQLPPEKQRDVLLDIQSQAGHMLQLLNELLDISQIDAGRLELKLAPVDLRSALASTVARHAQMAAAKEILVQLEAVPAEEVLADALRLRQVLDNLISNAVKYSPADSTVKVDAVCDSTVCTIHVRDEGPGIKPEERGKLFKDFSRLSTQPTGGESSTGLGLAITRRIVEAHGGQIGVESSYGHGATFWFTLPLVPPE